MTREAKIGMLTGLGVIVLIGVLLSKYLGEGVAGGAATGRMAELPLGETYRKQVMQPVGVPGMVPADAAVTGGQVTAGPLSMNEVPKAFAAVDTRDASGNGQVGTANQAIAGQPIVGQPVTAVPTGPLADGPISEAKVPTIELVGQNELQAASSVAGQSEADAGKGTTSSAPTASQRGLTYVIVSNDSLAKIAKKFYHSTKSEDLQRIVAANPKILKNDKTMLIVGKKLFIPSIVQTAAPATGVKTAQAGKPNVVIHPPGTKNADQAATTVKKTASAVYVVQDGDSLGKIAAKLSSKGATVSVKALMAANGLKDGAVLQVGEKLKVPAK
jgi:LysM repeat protein